MRKARRSPRIERSRHRCRGGCHFSDHDQLINAALAAWFGASEERPRSHQRGTLVDGERTTPNSARRKQGTRSSRANMKRCIGCYWPN